MPNTLGLFIVIGGNLIDGYEAVGPFDTEERADEWIDYTNRHDYTGDDFRVLPVREV